MNDFESCLAGVDDRAQPGRRQPDDAPAHETQPARPWQGWLKCQHCQKPDALTGVAPATLAIGLWLSGAAAAHVANMNTPKLGIAVEQ